MKIHVSMSDRSPTVVPMWTGWVSQATTCEHGEPKVFLYLWSLSHRSAADSACLSAQQSFSLKNCPLTPETGQAGTSDEKFQAIQLYIYIYLTYIIYNIYTHCKYMLQQIGMTGALLEDMVPLGSQGDRLEVVMLLPRLSRGVIIHSQKDYTNFKVSLRGRLLTCDFFKRSQSIAYIIYISCIYIHVYIYIHTYIHILYILFLEHSLSPAIHEAHRESEQAFFFDSPTCLCKPLEVR